MTAPTIAHRIRSMLGSTSVVETDRTGHPRVAPDSEDGVSLVLGTAAQEGWRVKIEGGAGWMPTDAPADVTLSTQALTQITHLDAPDLVATAQAGVWWSALRDALAEHGTWVPADPPGGDRTVGSVTATGTSGPLRAGFGGIREHLLGLTIVTGEGRVVRPGGRVVKNVAGFDLTKLAAGSYGAFGVITSVTLRLRAVPRADTTLVAQGVRDELLASAISIMEAGLTPAAMELLSPVAAGGSEWLLAVRLVGAPAATRAECDAVLSAARRPLAELPGPAAMELWRSVSSGASSAPTTLRLGALPSALDDALDLVTHYLSESWLSVTVGAGTVRWSGDAPADRVRLLRHAAAQQEIPLTLERAPWVMRHEIGVFGAYREGVGRLVGSLTRAFDPAGILLAGIGAQR